MDTALRNVIIPTGENFLETWSVSIDSSTVFDEVDQAHRGKLSAAEVAKALTLRFGHHLPQQEVDQAILQMHTVISKDGLVTREEFENISQMLAEKCQQATFLMRHI